MSDLGRFSPLALGREPDIAEVSTAGEGTVTFNANTTFCWAGGDIASLNSLGYF